MTYYEPIGSVYHDGTVRCDTCKYHNIKCPSPNGVMCGEGGNTRPTHYEPKEEDVHYKWYVAGRSMSNGDKITLRDDGKTAWIYDPKADWKYKAIGFVDMPIKKSVLRGEEVRIRPLGEDKKPDYIDSVKDVVKTLKKSGFDVPYRMTDDVLKENKKVVEVETLKMIEERIERERDRRKKICAEAWEYYGDTEIYYECNEREVAREKSWNTGFSKIL